MRMLFGVAAVLVGLSVASPASAQSGRSERPFRGLFGGGVDGARQLLSVNASASGGYDDSLIADARGTSSLRPSDLTRSHRGGTSSFSGGLSYSLGLDRVALNASASATGRYYPSLGNDVLVREYASVSGATQLFRGFSVNAMMAYQPYSLGSLAPWLLTPSPGDPTIDLDDVASYEHFFSYGGGASYSRQLSRRTTATLGATYRARAATATDAHFSNRGGNGRITYAVGRGLSIRGGYGYSDARYSEAVNRYGTHHIDAGVDYNRSLSFSRRTTLSFGTGTTAVTRPGGENDDLRFRATGNVNLNHEIGRSWGLTAGYNRGLQLSESWPEPVFSDTVTVGLNGLINRRVQFNARGRASTGRIGFESSNDGFNNYYGSAGLSMAISRHLNTGVTYSYYRHRFDNLTLLAPGFVDSVDRNSVRAYVSFWAPLFSSSRRP